MIEKRKERETSGEREIREERRGRERERVGGRVGTRRCDGGRSVRESIAGAATRNAATRRRTSGAAENSRDENAKRESPRRGVPPAEINKRRSQSLHHRPPSTP